jgi:hypothetical protein
VLRLRSKRSPVHDERNVNVCLSVGRLAIALECGNLIAIDIEEI